MLKSDQLVGRDQCPACRNRGHDQSRDNLAIYADGHEICYRCYYYKPPRVEERIVQLEIVREESNKAPSVISLPPDAKPDFPPEVLSRLYAWGMTPVTLKRHSFMWSNTLNRLIMPVYDGFGQLLMYQTRSWEPGESKYLTFGKPHDILHIIRPLGKKESNQVVILCEDLISAIRISEYVPAMPIWGSDISLKTIQRLSTRFAVIGVWLDPDMKLKAVKDVIRISQYVPAFFIESHSDPKVYSLDRIKEHIDIYGYHTLYRDRETSTVTPTRTNMVCITDNTAPCPGISHGCCQG